MTHEENIFNEIALDLKSKIPWLDNCYGLTEKLDIKVNDKKESIPALIINNNRHIDLSPNSSNKNYSFFAVTKRTVESYSAIIKSILECSCVFWLDTTGLSNDFLTDAQKYFTFKKFLRLSSVTMKEIDNVTPFKDYSVKHEENRYMMQPYKSFRIDFELTYSTNKNC